MNGGWSLRGAGSDAAETELQADVMRFVAILALCLVAISTLVEQATSRDIPAERGRSAATVADPRPVPEPVQAEPVSVTTPVSPTPPPPSSTRVADAGVVTPVPEPAPERAIRATPAPRADPVDVPRPAPEPSPIPEAAPVTEMPRAEPETAATVTPAPEPARPDPPRRGFTLRFDSDAAMLRLVSRGEASVFLIDGVEAWQLGFGDSGAQFAQAPPPARFHAIAADTVPRLLRDAAAQSPGVNDAVWGVTLPEHTSRQLAGLLRDHDHGELVIDSRGRVRLEAGDEV